VGATTNNVDPSISFFSQKVSHQSLTWGTALRSTNIIFSLSEKLWTKKYPSRRFNHLSTTSTSILPSNIGISKLICTLKGVDLLLEVDASLVGSHRRICAKLSIISFLCRSRDSSRNILKGFHVPSYLFLCHGRFLRYAMRRFSSRETSSRPNSLYPDRVGDMH
jgi:hypothetical protein